MNTKSNTTPSPRGDGRTALIIGATGGFGGAVAQALATRGWHLRALHRDPERARRRTTLPPAIDWVPGDAMRPGDVVQAAENAALVVHAANPPGYRNWRSRAVPMLANTIDAARRSGARILFPGNVYNFGPDAWPLVSEDSPQNPVSRKGAVRVEMEAMLAEAADQGVRTLILRAGDFFGPHAPASWFETVMVRPGRAIRSVTWPGEEEAGHAFAYLPDMAEAAARLLEVDEARPARFETVNFGGHWCEPGIAFVHALARAGGQPGARIKRLPWALMRLAALFAPTVREALEMRYLWREPVRLDNAKLVSLIGKEPHTPLDEALRQTLAGLDCLTPRPARTVGSAAEPAA